MGNTVRRSTGPWTPAVHQLLAHLADAGFRGAPEVLGVDEHGREILTHVEGPVVWPDHFEAVSDPGALAAVGRTIREFHDAVGTFDLRSDHRWSDRGADPTGPFELVCHNDLAAWNLVAATDGWVFIDWDLAAPGRRSWDLAWAACSLVPLTADAGLDDQAVSDRLRIFCSSYGRPDLVAEIIEVAHERCEREAKLIRSRGGAGDPPYARLLADGHATAWSRAARHVAQRGDRWLRGTTGSGD